MRFVSIFVSNNSEDGLWSIHLDEENENEFDKFFNQMNDIEWPYNFFERNRADLTSGYFGNITIEQAVLKTMNDAGEIETTLYNYSEQGFTGSGINLQQFFKPLNNYEYAITIHQKSKARNRKSWLRIYAIRLDKNCYLVTGGAIKLTQNMKRAHLENELKKLEQAKLFLRGNGIDYPEYLNMHKDEEFK